MSLISIDKLLSRITTCYMLNEQSHICPNEYISNEGKLVNCMNYMLEFPEYPGYLRCSCGYTVKIVKTLIYIVKDPTNE